MVDFNADYGAMSEMSGRLRNGRTEIEGTLNNLQSGVGGLTSGEFRTQVASGTYNDSYTELTTSLQQAIVAIDEMATTLDGAIRYIQDADSGMLSRG